MVYIDNFFTLDKETKEEILARPCIFETENNYIGKIVFLRTYSRVKEDGNKESWNDVVIRCTEGIYTIQKDFFIKNKIPFNERDKQIEAKEYAFYLYYMCFLPSGRALFTLGTDLLVKRGGDSLYNCAAVSMAGTGEQVLRAIYALASMSFSGIGVSYCCTSTVEVYEPTYSDDVYIVEDSSVGENEVPQGWVDSIVYLISCYIGDKRPSVKKFDYNLIRKAGEPIKTFGGIAPGPQPLIDCHKRIINFFEIYLDINVRGKDKLESFNTFVEKSASEGLLFRNKQQMIKILEEKLTSIHPPYDLYHDLIYLVKNNTNEEGISKPKSLIDYIPNILEDYNDDIENIKEDIIKVINDIIKSQKEIMDDKARTLNLIRENIDKKTYGRDRLMGDINNAIGVAVCSGGVRRTALMDVGEVKSEEFINLKNYNLNPERKDIGWMSNNSVVLTNKKEFEKYIPKLAKCIRDNGEPGIINLINCRKYGLYRKTDIPDPLVIATNPCGEKPLEAFEVCNLAEAFPVRCMTNGKYDKQRILRAFDFATFTTTTVSLLPTRIPETNEVIRRNRRIGVSFGGGCQMYQESATKLIKYLTLCHDRVNSYNKEYCAKLGIRSSIRTTTIQPSGTKRYLTGTYNFHFPTFKYASRRIALAKKDELSKQLIELGFPYEQNFYTKDEWNFMFPIHYKSERCAEDVSIFEQVKISQVFQDKYTNSSNSTTYYYPPNSHESLIESVIATNIYSLKSMSLLPHTPDGVYNQMPFTKISKLQYKLLKSITDGKLIKNSITKIEEEKFCQGDKCEIRLVTSTGKVIESDVLKLIREPYNKDLDYTKITKIIGNKNKSLWFYPFLGLANTDKYVYFAMLPINLEMVTQEVINSCDKFKLTSDLELTKL